MPQQLVWQWEFLAYFLYLIGQCMIVQTVVLKWGFLSIILYEQLEKYYSFTWSKTHQYPHRTVIFSMRARTAYGNLSCNTSGLFVQQNWISRHIILFLIYQVQSIILYCRLLFAVFEKYIFQTIDFVSFCSFNNYFILLVVTFWWLLM